MLSGDLARPEYVHNPKVPSWKVVLQNNLTVPQHLFASSVPQNLHSECKSQGLDAEQLHCISTHCAF